MCGIAGILAISAAAAPPTDEELGRMVASLHHRGPDQNGIVKVGPAGLAHTRLSIIDLSGGVQPWSNPEATCHLVYNGEVFNYVELREELRKKGRVFRSESDTEVVLQAYEEWGEDAFVRFNGQFAIAIWDAPKGRLVLARDRLGVRPLHVCRHAGRLYFASEIKAIFASDPSVPRAIDPMGVAETLTFWTIVAPQTAFLGVEELRPAHVRVYEKGEMRERAFWTPRFPVDGEGGFQGSLEDAVDAVRAALEKAVALRMLRADVPVGAYVSGGLDSSLTTALARRATPARFSTFSVRFEDAEFDESEYQRVVARQLGTEHHELTVKTSDIARVFPEVVTHVERPILRTAPAPLFLLSKAVRDAGIKAVLTGEGADEMFAGYDSFREARVRRFWARQPKSTRRPMLFDRIYPYLARSPVAQSAMAKRFFGQDLADAREPGFGHATRWRTTSALKRLLAPAMKDALAGEDVKGALLRDLPPEFRRFSSLAQDQLIEMRTLLAGYLLSAQGDRLLMAHSVEGRFPFLDAEVGELANSLPPSYKLRVLDEKHVLKEASRGIIPDEIRARTKQPYRAPDAASFVGPASPDWIAESVSERSVREAGVFDPAIVGRLVEKCTEEVAQGRVLSNTDNMALVGVLSTQLLHHTFVKHRPGAGDRSGSPRDLPDGSTRGPLRTKGRAA